MQGMKANTEQAETLGNFAIASAEARDWPRAFSQMQQALEVCGECRIKADLHKNLGLILAKSGEI